MTRPRNESDETLSLEKRNERFIALFFGAVVGIPLAILVIVSTLQDDDTPPYHFHYPVRCELTESGFKAMQLYKNRVNSLTLTDGVLTGELIYRGRAANGGVALAPTQYIFFDTTPAHPYYDEAYYLVRNDNNNFYVALSPDCARALADALPATAKIYGDEFVRRRGR